MEGVKEQVLDWATGMTPRIQNWPWGEPLRHPLSAAGSETWLQPLLLPGEWSSEAEVRGLGRQTKTPRSREMGPLMLLHPSISVT